MYEMSVLKIYNNNHVVLDLLTRLPLVENQLIYS